MDFEGFAETTAFRQVARIVTALSIQDERIVDEFRAIQQGRRPSGKIVEIKGCSGRDAHVTRSVRRGSENATGDEPQVLGILTSKTFKGVTLEILGKYESS
jgi:hypothetical protein